MIAFNVPAFLGNELDYIRDAIKQGKLSGNGYFTGKCSQMIEKMTGTLRCMMTTSCTHALEMAAMLAGVGPGDEVIMPSFTFTSTANAFIVRGATVAFVDIRKDTMNLDEKALEAAITDRTKVIVPVHYAGISCEMDTILKIASRRGILVVEDAAQGVMSSYKGRALGSMGDFGCYSFHETKNYNCGEGGSLLIRDARFIERAEIIWEKGTDRQRFFRGEVDKYTWVEMGSSYLPSELNMAYLCAQLEQAGAINNDRLATWNLYNEGLKMLADRGDIEMPFVPQECVHNGHMFYIKVAGLDERQRLINNLKDLGIMAIFHYVPLHSSPAGKKYGHFIGEDVNTTRESERLLRLPLYYNIGLDNTSFIIDSIRDFFKV
ncbi:MAG: dTDP-4-amino-4,6-dideoxygalactose transaminase [Spirochaetia bacterium]|nr:dTDP-4-amino-4,6-dideoxygalactose transaminase [Spirochaetia bacterium]